MRAEVQALLDGYELPAGMATALVTTLLGVGIELLKKAGHTDFAWPGGVPWYVFVMTAAVVVTIACSLFTHGATGDRLDRRVRLAMDL